MAAVGDFRQPFGSVQVNGPIASGKLSGSYPVMALMALTALIALMALLSRMVLMALMALIALMAQMALMARMALVGSSLGPTP